MSSKKGKRETHLSIDDWAQWYEEQAYSCYELRNELEKLRNEGQETSLRCRGIQQLLNRREAEGMEEFF